MNLYKKIFISLLTVFALIFLSNSVSHAATLTVPGQFSSIQAAHDAASIGDVIKVSPGSYSGFTVSKQITIEGASYDQANPRNNTVKVNGQVIIQNGNWAWNQGPVIRGFYITAVDPVRGLRTAYTLEYSFINAAGQGSDGVSFESAGGVIRGNIVDPGGDDNIDVDTQTMDILVENNVLRNANQDGIEIRQQPTTIAQRVTLTFRSNRVENSGQDGIQIMDYTNFTNRRYIVERNLFIGAGSKGDGAGIGIMAADVTTENFSAAPMPEPLYAVNNVFLNGDAGISGGANLIAINNIFSGNTVFDLKNVNGRSKVMNSLFATSAKLQGTNNLDSATTKTGNPLFDASYGLSAGSPAIDAGLASYQHTYSYNGSGGGSAQTITEYVINLNNTQYNGNAPDLGWKETGMSGTPPPLSPTTQPPTSTPQPTGGPTSTPIPGGTQVSLTIFLHGLGKAGDNVSPGTTGNMNPLNPQRNVGIEFFNANGLSSGVKNGILSFNTTEGSFKGNINAGNLASGIYTARVNSNYYLAKFYPGFVNITQGGTNNLPTLALITGDSNLDNKLSILDYNIILDCYADLTPPRNCPDNQKKLSADLTDDGAINQFDYNLFLRELSVQGDGGGVTGTPFPTLSINPSTLPSNTPNITQGPSVTPTGDKITYTVSSEDFPNPERGFMKQSSILVDQPFDAAKITTLQPSDTNVWIYFRLDNYRDPRDGVGVTVANYSGKLLEPLGSGKGLDTVKAAFSEARKKGLKLVIRFIYNPGPGSSSNPMQVNPDVPLSLALQHINQLKPLLVDNTDVIAAVQIGFVGHWGEWHSSKYLGSLESRKAIIDAHLAAVPKEKMLLLRYPRYKQLFYGGPVTEVTAYNQSDVSRIGLFDDAFLKDDTDDGTFKSTAGGVKVTTYCDSYPAGETACWRDYVGKDTRFLAVSAEAGTHSSTPSTYAQCPNALVQLANLHMSLVHNGYAKVVLDNWIAQGCMPEIRRRLGYRLELKEATIPKTVAKGQTYGLQVVLKNTGFASMYNPRPVYLVLFGPQRYEILMANIDPRRWEAGKEVSIPFTLTIPANTTPGVYKLGLWLPDASTTLKNTPAYSVRFANSGVWDQASGINILTSSFTVAQ